MKCENPDIPPYLHWNNRKVYGDKNFLYFHKLFRLKEKDNPIDIDRSWVNAISCRWSKIVWKEHIMLQPPKEKYKDYDFVFLQEIRKYQKIGYFDNQDHLYSGRHVLTCEMHHNPLVCDYSHVEILIRHKVYKNRDSTEELIFNEVYTYEDWKDKKALLAKERARFFKELKQSFRLDMIKLISRPAKNNFLWYDIIGYCHLANRKTGIETRFQLDS